MRGIGPFLKDAWRLARPYFMTSEERWSARGLLVAIIAMNLTLVALSVVLSFWRREFYNTLQDKDWKAFLELLFFYRRTDSGFMPGFCEVAGVHIILAVYSVYLNQMLQIRWRRWLTREYLNEWLSDRAYYNISLTADRAAVGTDNPDQRISEDLRDFTSMSLSLTLDLLSNIVSLCSFVGILWGLSGAIEAFGIPIPGYMVWVALAYALIGTTLTHLVGRPLSILNFRQQRVEADFRYALVRIRENMESIALYRGEEEEGVTLRDRFAACDRQLVPDHAADQAAELAGQRLCADRHHLPHRCRRATLFLRWHAVGRPDADRRGVRVGAELHVMVRRDLYADIARWRAIVERLSTFHRAIVKARAETHGGFVTVEGKLGVVQLRDVTMNLPDGTRLLDHADLTFTAGHSIMITGRTGSGKSTLFRVLAGIWPFGHGEVEVPPNSFFLPQRPYIPLGTLRHVITYPNATDAFSDQEIDQALRDAGLPNLCDRVDQRRQLAAAAVGRRTAAGGAGPGAAGET